MKKAILYLILFIGMFGVAMIPEKLSFLFFIDYVIRLAIIRWAGMKLVELDKESTRA